MVAYLIATGLLLSSCGSQSGSSGRVKNGALNSGATVSLTKCEDLAKCQVGESGPGGGVIISVNRGTYTEMAPAGWNGGATDPLVSANDAVRVASDYRGGGLADWTLIPSEQVARTMCVIAGGQASASSQNCGAGTVDAQFGDGKANGNSYYWYKEGSSISGKMDFVSGVTKGSLSSPAYVRPVRIFRYVAPTTSATSTTIPASCALNGPCAVGDISPAGNLIIDVQTVGQKIQYVEIAPKTWSDGRDPSDTRRGGMTLAANYQGPKSTDWRLPTIAEMRSAYVYFSDAKFDNDCRNISTSNRQLSSSQIGFSLGGSSYWVIDESARDKYVAFDVSSGAVYFNADSYQTAWGTKTDGNVAKRYVRPVRTVEYTGPAITVTPFVYSPARCKDVSAPTTAPPTTVAVNCAGRGRCSVGDIGPNGGIIIAVNKNAVDGPEYTEMAKLQSSNADCAGTNISSKCVKRSWFDGSYSAPFGSYPTVDELKAVAANKTLMANLQLRKDQYWTNRYRKTVGMINGDFTGNLTDLGRSLTVSIVKAAYSVNMSNGKDDTSTTAYFRGVTRWKCQAACVGW
jgi:hypothetical protein